MATETGDGTDAGGVSETGESTPEGVSPYIRSVVVTTVATLAGIVAGISAQLIAAGPTDVIGLALLAVAILVQLPIYRAVGIDTTDFGTKDQLYIGFMTFVLWFVSYSILLTTNAL